MSNFVELAFGKSDREQNIDKLKISGEIPNWLEGIFIRNGPGTFEVGQQKYRHWFDGLAMLHKFTFKNGNVGFANKFLECNAYNEAMKKGKISYSEYATDPHRSLFQRVTSIFNRKITDSAKVNIATFSDHYLALGEHPTQIMFDPDTLKSIGEYYYETKYKWHITTVHPVTDLKTNETYQLVSCFSRKNFYRMLGVDKHGKTRVVGQIPVLKPAYLHSFGLSRKYLIIAEFPLVVNPINLIFQLKPFIENFNWKHKKGTTFYVMNRNDGEVIGKFQTDAFFAFHHVNAFEQNGELILDIDAYEDASIINSFYINRIKDDNLELPFGRLTRFRIDLKGHEIIKREVLSDACIEMPRYYFDKYNMNSNYRYVYGLSVNNQYRKGFYNQLIKIDIRTGKTKNWFNFNHYPSEPIFIPNPLTHKEEDGIIMTIVLNVESKNSYLLILNAESFEEIGRAEVAQPILMGYHGAYFAK